MCLLSLMLHALNHCNAFISKTWDPCVSFVVMHGVMNIVLCLDAFLWGFNQTNVLCSTVLPHWHHLRRLLVVLWHIFLGHSVSQAKRMYARTPIMLTMTCLTPSAHVTALQLALLSRFITQLLPSYDILICSC